ncbi:MAG: efflux RND transporter periplasmic adaptor subunit, partial [Cyanobacteria bacterium J06636_16]
AAAAAAAEDVEAAVAGLRQSEATLAQAQANQAAAQENLSDRTVTAPIAGTVGDIQPNLGDYVTPSNVITNITENATLELDLEVPIEQRDQLRLGLPVELIGVDGEEILASGSITFISPQINADTQTVLVQAQFDNPQGRLQDAQKVEARLIWSEQTGVLVPTSAITRLGGQTFVYVAEEGSSDELPPPEAMPPGMEVPEQVARLRPVQLGNIQGNNYEVLSGVDPGETIVVSGILNLQDGTPILPQSGDEPQAGQ